MTSSTPATGWSRTRLLAGATIGLIGGFTTTFFATSSQFVRPITQEFGWGRAELSVVIVLAMLGSAFAAPPAGRLVARYGPRPVVAASGMFLAAGLALLSAAPASQGYFALVALLTGVLAVGTTPVELLAAVPRFFDRRFGLALGAVMGFSAIGGGVLQVVVGRFLAQNGWRSAYLLLAAAAFVTILVAVLIGFPRGAGPERHDTDQHATAAARGSPSGRRCARGRCGSCWARCCWRRSAPSASPRTSSRSWSTAASTRSRRPGQAPPEGSGWRWGGWSAAHCWTA